MVNLFSAKSIADIYKKLIFAFLFFSAIIFCFPSFALGAVMEITVTITRVRIPERSAMMLLANRPNTEFSFGSGRIVVVNKDSYIENRADFPNNSFRAGKTVTFFFPYDTSKAPYRVYGESHVAVAGTHPICKADCSSITDLTGWYYFYIQAFDGSDWVGGYCPYVVCNARYHDELAVTNVFVDSVDMLPYWRSAVLYTIN